MTPALEQIARDAATRHGVPPEIVLTDELLADARNRALRTLRRMGISAEDAEDAVQDAFLRAVKTTAQFEGRSAFSTWFTRVAINSARINYRSRKSRISAEPIEEETLQLPCPRQLICDWMIDEESRDRVRRAVDKLPEKLRVAVIAFYLADDALIGAAESLGIHVVALKTRLFHARHILLAKHLHAKDLSAFI